MAWGLNANRLNKIIIRNKPIRITLSGYNSHAEPRLSN